MSSDALAPRDHVSLQNKEEGVPTRRAEFRAFARKVVEDEDYQKNLLERAKEGSLSPAVERLLLEAAYCSVKVDEQGGAEEARRAKEMREGIERLIRSGRSDELDARTMGARRVLRLPPQAVRRVTPEGEDDGDAA